MVYRSLGYLPYTHFLLRQITVTPRVLPSNEDEIKDLRLKMNTDLDMFLQLDIANDKFYVDNSAPLHFGFYTGFYWTYQLNNMVLPANPQSATTLKQSIDYSNVVLKTKLYHAYLKVS